MIDLPNDVDHDNKQVYDIETEYINSSSIIKR